ncbi:hypothetical protein [Streptosporangium sp. NPDC004631]
MTYEGRPTADDLLRHARQYHELATLLKYDKDFEDTFSAAVEAGDEVGLGSLLAPLGIQRFSVIEKDARDLGNPCEHCWVWHGKWVCVPICM